VQVAFHDGTESVGLIIGHCATYPGRNDPSLPSSLSLSLSLSLSVYLSLSFFFLGPT